MPPASIPAAMMPQAEARRPADAGGSTATTMRRSAGGAAIRAASIASRFHRASARSSMKTAAGARRSEPCRAPARRVSLERSGDVLLAQGDLAGALAAYEEELEVR